MQKLGKYVVVRMLGAGGMGVVYEARDPTLDRAVAIKLLNDRADPERFKREAKLAARVGHANCVPIYHADEHDGQFYVVMELVVGQNASQYLDRHRPIPWQTATKLVIAAGRGLAAVHDAGLIHRDIKPSNILISKAGVVKLTDFGLARSVEKDGPSLTGDNAVGTPHYMSPEQCWNEPVDARSDVYSLGATYFVLLTGRAPYSAAHDLQVMFAHCNDPVPEPRAARPDLPEECAAVIHKAMAKAPADRYQTAREFVAALEAVLAMDPNPPTADLAVATPDIQIDDNATPIPNDPTRDATPRPERAELRPTRRKLLFALPALAAGGVGAYFLWRNTRPNNQPDGNGHAGGTGEPHPLPVFVPVRKVGGFVGAVAVSNDARWLAVGLVDPDANGVKLFDRSLGNAPEMWWQWRQSDCRGVGFSPDGTLLAASGGGSETLHAWSLTEKKPVEFRGPKTDGNVGQLAFSPDGKLLAASVLRPDELGANYFRLIRVWDVATRAHLRDIGPLKGEVRGLSFASDGTTLAVGVTGADLNVREVEVWNATDATKLKTLRNGGGPIGPRAAYARRARLLAITTANSAQLFFHPSYEPHPPEYISPAEPGAIALTDDGRLSALSVVDGIVIWDTDTGQARGTMEGHTEPIFALTFTTDGKTLISGSDDKSVREWTRILGKTRSHAGAAGVLVMQTPPPPRSLTVSEQDPDTPLAGLRLDRISTHMTTLQDAERFVMRYGRAIRGYVTAILRDPAEADEVVQELILGLLRRGGPSTWPGAGRFRDYLKTSARNAAITYLRKKGRNRATEFTPETHPDPDSTEAAADRAMVAAWQACVLDKVFRELDAHERKSPGNLCYTALKVYTEFPDEDSPRQAAIAAERRPTAHPGSIPQAGEPRAAPGGRVHPARSGRRNRSRDGRFGRGRTA